MVFHLLFHAEHDYNLTSTQIWSILFPILRVEGVPRSKDKEIIIDSHPITSNTTWDDVNDYLRNYNLHLKITPFSITVMSDQTQNESNLGYHPISRFYLSMIDSYAPSEIRTILGMFYYNYTEYPSENLILGD